MGIRKHFEQQKDTEDLKIHELGLDIAESKKQSDFDVEQEIKPQDWQGIMRDLDFYRTNDSRIYKFLAMAYEIKIISPDKFAELNLGEQDYEKAKHDLQNQFKKKECARSYIYAQIAKLKIIFPDHFKYSDFDELAHIEGYLEEMQHHKHTFLKSSKDFALLFPNRKNPFLDNVWRKYKDEFYSVMQKSDPRPGVLELLADLKLVYPNESRGLVINDVTLEYLSEDPERCRKQYEWLVFVNVMANLKIYFSGQIRITDQGIELNTVENNFQQQKKKRPERKTF